MRGRDEKLIDEKKKRKRMCEKGKTLKSKKKGRRVKRMKLCKKGLNEREIGRIWMDAKKR
jgi:hypothetical protein